MFYLHHSILNGFRALLVGLMVVSSTACADYGNLPTTSGQLEDLWNITRQAEVPREKQVVKTAGDEFVIIAAATDRIPTIQIGTSIRMDAALVEIDQ